jgi:hypothetical protein
MPKALIVEITRLMITIVRWMRRRDVRLAVYPQVDVVAFFMRVVVLSTYLINRLR